MGSKVHDWIVWAWDTLQNIGVIAVGLDLGEHSWAPVWIYVMEDDYYLMSL